MEDEKRESDKTIEKLMTLMSTGFPLIGEVYTSKHERELWDKMFNHLVMLQTQIVLERREDLKPWWEKLWGK